MKTLLIKKNELHFHIEYQKTYIMNERNHSEMQCIYFLEINYWYQTMKVLS